MVRDRRERYELVQALLRARNRKHEDNLLENVAQSGTASGDGIYGEPMFGGTSFSFASQPDAATVDKAASQPHNLIPTPRPHPFRDPARFFDTGEVADMAEPRGFPAHDQLAFNVAPSPLSRPPGPQNFYDQPLAVSAGGAVRPRYWGLFPPYRKPNSDGLTFPPQIYQGKKRLTKADKDACHDQFFHDNEQCNKNYSYTPDAWWRCHKRAVEIRDLCLRGEKQTKPWSDPDEDGIFLPKPPNRRKKKK